MKEVKRYLIETNGENFVAIDFGKKIVCFDDWDNVNLFIDTDNYGNTNLKEILEKLKAVDFDADVVWDEYVADGELGYKTHNVTVLKSNEFWEEQNNYNRSIHGYVHNYFHEF